MRNTDSWDKIGWLAIAALFGVAAPALGQATFTGLGDFAGGNFISQAYAVTADGSVVVGSGGTSTCGLAFRWTAAGGMVSLGDLPGGQVSSRANGISGDGSIVVGMGQTSVSFLAFIWTAAGGMVSLGELPGGGVFSEAKAISADGDRWSWERAHPLVAMAAT